MSFISSFFSKIGRTLQSALAAVWYYIAMGLSKIWSGIGYILRGDGVSSLFFRDHLLTTCLFLIAGLLVIAMRFECLTSANKIDRLNDQINVMRTEKQRQRSQYMTQVRESAMMHLVDSLNLGLALPETHAKELHIKRTEQ